MAIMTFEEYLRETEPELAGQILPTGNFNPSVEANPASGRPVPQTPVSPDGWSGYKYGRDTEAGQLERRAFSLGMDGQPLSRRGATSEIRMAEGAAYRAGVSMARYGTPDTSRPGSGSEGGDGYGAEGVPALPPNLGYYDPNQGTQDPAAIAPWLPDDAVRTMVGAQFVDTNSTPVLRWVKTIAAILVKYPDVWKTLRDMVNLRSTGSGSSIAQNPHCARMIADSLPKDMRDAIYQFNCGFPAPYNLSKRGEETFVALVVASLGIAVDDESCGCK